MMHTDCLCFDTNRAAKIDKNSRTCQLYTGHWLRVVALNQNSGNFITTKAEKFVLKLTFFPQNDFIKRRITITSEVRGKSLGILYM